MATSYHTNLELDLSQIDFKQLKAQKMILIDIQSKLNTEQEAEHEAIEGLLSLIDYIQDTAVDECGVPDKEVYNLSIDDDEGTQLELSLEDCKRIVLFPEPNVPQNKSKLFYAIKEDERLHRWACASIRYNSTREYQAIDFRAKVSHLFPDAKSG